MEVQNYLGIYIGKERATVVCLSPNEGGGGVVGRFSVSVEGQEDAGYDALAALIAQGCAERDLQFGEAVVALDCSMFMQHGVHSEFSERRQIKSTIRFDTEEALATDIADVALAFDITSSGEHGSDVTVFTAKQEVLREILVSLQSHGLDPVGIEPDITSLSRFVGSQPVGDGDEGRVLFGLLSDSSGYLVLGSRGDEGVSWSGRTFLLGKSQNRGEVLTREVLVTSALAGSIDGIRVLDSAGQVDCESLGQRLGHEVSQLELGGDERGEDGDSVAYATAQGAAASLTAKGPSVDFRRDFMPYQGRKVRLESALKFMSVSLTVLLVAVGLYFQLKLMRANGYRGRLRDKFATDYAGVMHGEKLPDRANPLTKLQSNLTQTKKKGGPIGDADSIESQLVSVLNAVNRCASATDISVDSMTITSRNIVVAGDTKAGQNRNTLKFFGEVRNSGLQISTQRMSSQGGRDSFNITAVPK